MLSLPLGVGRVSFLSSFMPSAFPAYSRTAPVVCYVFLAWFVYLSTGFESDAGPEDPGETSCTEWSFTIFVLWSDTICLFLELPQDNGQDYIKKYIPNYLNNKEKTILKGGLQGMALVLHYKYQNRILD